jgi:methyltransferase
MAGLDSRLLYTGLVLLVALQRLAELALSRRHERRLRERGAIEVGAGHYPWMVALHAAFLASCLAEVWWLKRPFVPALAAIAIAALLAATGLRAWTLRTLGERWTTRVLVLPGKALVAGGPYRFLRHPNYLAVVLEVAALPLVHTAWATAIVFSALNLVLLRVRIGVEERALYASGAGV